MLIVVAILWIGGAFLVWNLWHQYNTRPSDLVGIESHLAKPPLIFKDEYGAEVVMMRLFVENRNVPLSIPGKVLNQANKRIFDLKVGTKLTFQIRKKEPPFTLAGQKTSLFSLKDDKGSLLELEAALSAYKGPIVPILVGYIVMIAATIFLIQWKGIN